ncbi:unnamed protein product [Vitrella brassicaformis CCMP3155]|uniref:PAS domain-containing protein n=1 Tax=Vitrella brassicaformis (strain CCMP3155) TaxID=1169540 RepID=A0A0G4EY02_VITBC|nr:unnamed protein product [Vitrella brassicaformis CCMP3155]|eukprot:CEM03295.1 unnamed protein product [Vitrella brassicaformis CCMP3155]
MISGQPDQSVLPERPARAKKHTIPLTNDMSELKKNRTSRDRMGSVSTDLDEHTGGGLGRGDGEGQMMATAGEGEGGGASSSLKESQKVNLEELREENMGLRKRLKELESQVEDLRLKYSMALAQKDRQLEQKDFDKLTFSSILCDPNQQDCPIILVSSGFCDLTGYSPWEVIGVNCRFLQCEDSDMNVIGQIKQYINRIVNEPTVHLCDDLVVKILNQRKDKRRFWNLLHISPLMIGQRIYLIGVQADVTHLDVDPNNQDHRDKVRQVVKKIFEMGEVHSELCI